MLEQAVKLYRFDKIKLITYLCITLHFLFNFLGLPALKWLFLVELLLILLLSFTVNFETLIIPLLAFFMIEGQGRVLWEYHPLIRNSFDLILLCAMLKGMVQTRTITNLKKIPIYIIFLIVLHFLWYLLQLFNIDNVGFIGVLAASKIYIVPILFFFFYLKNDTLIQQNTLTSIQRFCIYLILLECSLVIFQTFNREELLINISSYYEVIMRGIFVGPAFRPFGTSFVPGGISVNLFLLLPFVLFVAPKNTKQFILQIVTISISITALFLLQVRSASVKYLLICAFFLIMQFTFSNNKVRYLLKSALGISLFVVLIFNLDSVQKLFPDIDLTYSTERFSTITYNLDNLKTKRISADTAIRIISTKLQSNPLGLGPGRTGAASSFSQAEIDADPIYNASSSWAHDNLLVSLAIDLGIGMFFYLIVILLFPILISYKTAKNFPSLSKEQKRILITASISLLVILSGNWGAIGIPYNPESFIYWLLIAMGINTYEAC